jgi:hypothetical protein
MNNYRFRNASQSRMCECGQQILNRTGVTRIRHIVSCFVNGHTYQHVMERNSHEEYMCTRCGHPLLLRRPALHRTRPSRRFRKKVRYLCNLFGHKVHPVTVRQSLFEYACFCGHTFVKRAEEGPKITHPVLCLVAGHYVEWIASRRNLSEFACKNCGHTFLVA